MRLVSAIYNDAGPFMNINNVNSFHVSMSHNDLTTNDILLLHGGEDISPSLYNHEVSKHTYAGASPSQRDKIEWEMLERAKKLGIPVIGICRGLQMLCASAGGYLIQHVDNHGGNHTVVDKDGEEFIVNSIHHQMTYPFDVDHKLFAWVQNKRSGRHLLGNGRSITLELSVEPEAVFFPQINGFGVQFHPEFGNEEDRFVHWSVEKANELFS